MRGELFVALVLCACHDPSTKTRPSPEQTATPPVPPSPASPAGVTTTHAAEIFARDVDGSTKVQDGAVACTVIMEPGAPGAGPEYRLENTGNTGLSSCRVVFYAYDAKGTQLARVEADPIALARQKDKDAKKVLGPAEEARGYVSGAGDIGAAARRRDVTWEPVVVAVRFADGATWSDASRAPATRAMATPRK